MKNGKIITDVTSSVRQLADVSRSEYEAPNQFLIHPRTLSGVEVSGILTVNYKTIWK